MKDYDLVYLYRHTQDAGTRIGLDFIEFFTAIYVSPDTVNDPANWSRDTGKAVSMALYDFRRLKIKCIKTHINENEFQRLDVVGFDSLVGATAKIIRDKAKSC